MQTPTWTQHLQNNGSKQNIITNPAFSLREAKKRRLLQDTVPQLISWKQHKKRLPCTPSLHLCPLAWVVWWVLLKATLRPFDVLRVSTLNGSSRFERDGGTVKNLSVLRNDGAFTESEQSEDHTSSIYCQTILANWASQNLSACRIRCRSRSQCPTLVHDIPIGSEAAIIP